MDIIKKTSKQIIRPKLIYISISVVIGLVVIAILTFAVFANQSSQEFAVSTFSTIKGDMQSSEQGYNTILTIFENQYSSFVSSLALVLSIFTITISLAATLIPYISTKKELDAINKEFDETKKMFSAMTEKQNEIQNKLDEQRKIISDQLDDSVKNVKSIGILIKQSLLAYRALSSNRIAEYEYYYNYVQGLYPNNPLVYQYQADEYYELIKCNKNEDENNDFAELYKENYNDTIQKAIDLYLKAIKKHKIEILKKKEEFFAAENVSLEFHYVKGLEDEKSDKLKITDKLLDNIKYLDKTEYEQAFRNCAFLQHMLGNSESAIELLEEALIIAPKDHDARNMLGCVYCDINNFEKSIELFETNKKQMVPAIYDNSYTCMLIGITYWKQYTLSDKDRDVNEKKAYQSFLKIENKNVTIHQVMAYFSAAMLYNIEKSGLSGTEKDKEKLNFQAMQNNIPPIYIKKINTNNFMELTKDLSVNIDFAKKYFNF